MFQRLVKPLKSKSFFLFGARGTGKSTWLRHFYSNQEVKVIDLLSPNDFNAFYGKPEAFEAALNAFSIEGKTKVIVVDEIQKDPSPLDVVHRELSNHKRFLFVLTGSSSRKLKRGGANLLAGRAFLNQMHPLTFVELSENFKLNDVLRFGSLPEVFEFNSEEKIEFLRSYVQVYLREEILEEQLVRNGIQFYRFLEIAAQMNAKILNYSSIARECQMDSSTIQNFFDILEDTYLGFRIYGYSKSIRKQQNLAPKFYFFDLGVQKALQRLSNFDVHEGTSAYGESFETFVVLECIRLNSYLRTQFAFSYFRSKDGAKVDLILEDSNRLFLVEIKSKSYVDPVDVKSLARLSKDFKPTRIFLLSQIRFREIHDNVECFPVLEGIKEIFSLK